jgi:hypothetical protein
MQELALLFGIIATFGCSDQKASRPSVEDSPTLESWSEGIYRESPTRKESLRCETESFLFSIGTDQDWTALFFMDKRTHPNVGVSSSAYFMRDGRRLVPTIGDAGDGRTPGVKLLKTSQSFDAMLFEYQLGDHPPEHVIFSYVNGAWSKPKQEGEPQR